MKTVKTTLPPEEYDLLDTEAGRQGLTVAEMMRRLLRAGLRVVATERMIDRNAGEHTYQTTAHAAPRGTGAW